uniref:Uncharacterized protein n=1 Tax=Timema genevievae TaxID=629358 RepID=A0A7R9K605_TIMGE|nr:unnamed protein product [Timema genevievae]
MNKQENGESYLMNNFMVRISKHTNDNQGTKVKRGQPGSVEQSEPDGWLRKRERRGNGRDKACTHTHTHTHECINEQALRLTNRSGYTLKTIYSNGLGIGKVEYRGSQPAFAWRESGKPIQENQPPVHPTEILTLISPSSADELNRTSALANYATEAGFSHMKLALSLILLQ